MDANAQLKAEVKELLSQLFLKLKDVKDLGGDTNDKGRYNVGGPEEIYDEATDDYIQNPDRGTKDERFLFATKEIVEDLVKSDYAAERMLEKYYTSTCW